MPTVSEALDKFLHARQIPANVDLIARWGIYMETQVNIAVGDGEPVAGRRSTYSNGTDTWHSIRIPKDANSEPTWEDYELRYAFTEHAEGIGMTGWDWKARCSRWVAYDFDALTSHARGVGVTDEALEAIRQAAMQLPYVEVRKSTGGGGLHLYVYLDAIPCENHTVHAALARCILGMMSSECNFDFASRIDCCGGVMWVWHRKLTTENGGLTRLKETTKVLKTADLPTNWRDHIEVVTRQRNKVRINEIKDSDLDPFEALAAAQKIIPLDEGHKAIIEALQRTHYTTLWIADHHLLQTHTCALTALMDSPEATELKLTGIFKTSSPGRNPGNPNCFLFPLSNSGWRVYRFSPGVSEAETWNQDGKGWTTCYFNRRPDLATAAKSHGGIEDPDKDGYVFSAPEKAAEAAKLLGQDTIPLDNAFRDRQTILKRHKDGRLIMEIERTKDDTELKESIGWLNKKTKWVRIFETIIPDNKDADLDASEYDKAFRALDTTANQFAGWTLWRDTKWIDSPASNVKLRLQSLGNPKDKAECIMGSIIGKSWQLVNLPFREEHPGGRQWNRDAAQFSVLPATLEADQAPQHPHWDLIFDHLGIELTPTLHMLPWAQRANIKTGADYMRAWVACAFRDPFVPLPYIFLHGKQESGKSTFHEALSLLVTKGVVKADRVLKSHNDFNKELAGAVICVVEETNVAQVPGALDRIKEYTTALTLPIREMRTNVYYVPNTTHWIQCANFQSYCPILTGDTRITVIEVSDLLPEQQIPKPLFLVKLKEEVPHFLYTLLNLELPPIIGRMRLPVVTTASKAHLEELNKDPLQQFIETFCVHKQDARMLFGEFFDAFQKTLDAGEKGPWTKLIVAKKMLSPHKVIRGVGNLRYVENVAFRPLETFQ